MPRGLTFGGREVRHFATYNGSSNAQVHTIDRLGDSEFSYVLGLAGSFTQAVGQTAQRVAVYSEATNSSSDMGSPLGPGSVLYTMQFINSPGDSLVGGNFVAIAGADTIRNFAIVDDDGWIAAAGGADASAYDIGSVDGSTIRFMIGGNFEFIGDYRLIGFGMYSRTINEIANYYGLGIQNGDVDRIILDESNHPVIMGNFDHAGAAPGPRVSRWDGFRWDAIPSDTLYQFATPQAVAARGGTTFVAIFSRDGDVLIDHDVRWPGLRLRRRRRRQDLPAAHTSPQCFRC